MRKAGLQKVSRGGDVVGVGQQRPAARTAVKVHLLLDGLSQVLHDMEPVGDLFRLRGPLPGSLGAEPAAVSADHFHLGMSLQPVGAGDDISILENLNDHATLQIDNVRDVDPIVRQCLVRGEVLAKQKGSQRHLRQPMCHMCAQSLTLAQIDAAWIGPKDAPYRALRIITL